MSLANIRGNLPIFSASSIPHFGHQIKSIMCQHWGSTQKYLHKVNEMFLIKQVLSVESKHTNTEYSGKAHKHHPACKVIKITNNTEVSRI